MLMPATIAGTLNNRLSTVKEKSEIVFIILKMLCTFDNLNQLHFHNHYEGLCVNVYSDSFP